MDDLYREVVMDHFRSPRGKAEVDNPNLVNVGVNPLCGDEIKVAVKFDGDRVVGVQALSHGCSISVASASMMAELLAGRTREEAGKLIEAFRAMMRGESQPEGLELGDLEALQGVRKYPVRVKCALLPWMTLKDALTAEPASSASPTSLAGETGEVSPKRGGSGIPPEPTSTEKEPGKEEIK